MFESCGLIDSHKIIGRIRCHEQSMVFDWVSRFLCNYSVVGSAILSSSTTRQMQAHSKGNDGYLTLVKCNKICHAMASGAHG